MRGRMNSVVRASGRGLNCLSFVGLCASFASALLVSACVEGDPIPADVVQRAETVLLEGNLGGGVSPAASSSDPASSTSAGAPSASSPDPLAPQAPLPNFANPSVVPQEELQAQDLGEEAIPEDAIPLLEFYQ